MRWLEWFGYKPSLAAFARLMIAQLGRDGSPWRFDAEAGSLVNDEGQTINPGNMHMAYLAAPLRERGELLRRWCGFAIGSRQEIPDLWVVAQRKLRTVVRGVHDLALSEIDARGATMDLVRAPIAADFERRLACDFEHHMALVPGAKLATWGVDADTALAIGTRNVAGLSAVEWSDNDGVFLLSAPEGYTESYLLVDRVVAQLPFAAHAVLASPNRGWLLAVDGRSAAAVDMLAGMVRRLMESEPWPQSAALLQRGENGEWRALDAPASVRNLERWWRACRYSDQKAALEKRLAREHRDVYVASCGTMEKDGELSTWTSWADGVVALLPRTEIVGFAPGDGEMLFVAWDDVVAVAGGRLQAQAESPPRFLVESFPDATEWQALALRAVHPAS